MIATSNPALNTVSVRPLDGATVIVDTKLNDRGDLDDANGEGLRRAGRSVTGCIWEDERLPDPNELLSKPYDETSAALDLSPSMQTITEGVVKLARLVVLPELLISQYSEQSRCFMGFATSIGHAWMTFDEKLYLWNFKSNRDIASWQGDEANGPIIDVHIAVPRKGVFVEAIRHVLVVVTPIEVRILGVQLVEPSGDLILHDTKLVFGTDQVNFLSAISDCHGRIFCGGQDGHIYELEYEAEEGWFTRRCRKTNRTGTLISRLAPTFLKGAHISSSNAIVSLVYDQSRHIIWSLSDSNSIDAFNIQEGSWSHIGQFHFVPEEIQRGWNLTRSTVGEKIGSVHPIGLEESKYLCLMAVTQSGLRLYYGSTSPKGSDWRLLHVRVPQPIHDLKPSGGSGAKFNLTFLAASMASVNCTFQRAGLYISAGALSNEEDILSIKGIRGTLNATELSNEWRLEGKVWEITETTTDTMQSTASNWWSDLVSGHESLPRQLLVLTNAGIEAI